MAMVFQVHDSTPWKLTNPLELDYKALIEWMREKTHRKKSRKIAGGRSETETTLKCKASERGSRPPVPFVFWFRKFD